MTKAEARREARARLRAITADERSRAAMVINQHLWTLPDIERARTILLYAALPEEVPTASIAAAARERGVVVVYPRCLQEGRLTLHRVSGPDQLTASSRFGIPEPALDCPLVSVEEIDAALIPGLAWSRTGHRLGRGGGYFDRLLATPDWCGFRCGVFFSVQEMDELPSDPWDVPLDAVVTEAGVLSKGRGTAPATHTDAADLDP